MNPIEILIFVGRPVAILATLGLVGWFTSRRVARQASGPDPVRQFLDQKAASRPEMEAKS